MTMSITTPDLMDASVLVTIAGSDDGAMWNTYVARHDGSTFFHRFEWAGVIQRTYGHKPVYLMASDGQGTIKGILPLIHVKSPLFGNALISTAFTVGGGILADDPATEFALTEAAGRIGQERGVGYVELRGGPGGESWQQKSGTYAGFIREISVDADQNLAAIPRKKRADVRKGIKAEEEGKLTVCRDGDVRNFHALYAQSVRNLGTPVLPRKLIDALASAFGADMDVAIVRSEGTPVAALVSFYHKGTVMPYYGGASPLARRVHAYDFMYWSQMRHAAEKGCTQFDFGRSKVATGAYDYKRFWGFEPHPLIYHYHLVKADEVPDVNPNNPKYRLLTKVWQKLPLPVANLAGPFIASQLG